MFQSLRPNSTLYVFYKGDNPRLEIGTVTTQPIIKPKFAMPPSTGLQQEMIVDIVAKVNNQSVSYIGLPANADIADSYANGDNIVLCTSREAMNCEISNLKQKSIDIINSIDTHKNMISLYDKILSELNPEYAEKKKQEQEITDLKVQLGEITKSMNDLMETNRKLIEQISKKEN